MGIISRLLGRLDDSNSVNTNAGRIRDKDFQGLIKNPDYDVKLVDGKIVVEHYPERGIYRAWFNSLSAKMRNNIGRLKGYGECSRCGGTWNWKKGHTIPYKASKTRTHINGKPYYPVGMFPLCEECYQECSPQERYDYCRRLWSRWGRPENEVEWNVVTDYVGVRSSARSAN